MKSSSDSKNCRNCFYLRIAAVIFWSSGLVVLSLLPNGNSLYLFSGQDKVLHFAAYLLTAWLVCRSLQLFSCSVVKSVVISIIYCTILGGTLELLQHSATRTRTAEWADMLANVAGAIFGCVIFCLLQKLSSTNHEQS